MLLSLLSLLGATDAALGEASVSLLVLQIFSVAAAYLAPLVYDQAARRASLPAAATPGLRLSPAGLAAALAGCALAGWALPWLLALALPEASAGLRLACQVMAAAGAVLLVNRLWATRVQARGGFALLSGLALLRLLASGLALLFFWQLAGPAPLAMAVLAAEVLVWVATAARPRWPGRTQ